MCHRVPVQCDKFTVLGKEKVTQSEVVVWPHLVEFDVHVLK